MENEQTQIPLERENIGLNVTYRCKEGVLKRFNFNQEDVGDFTLEYFNKDYTTYLEDTKKMFEASTIEDVNVDEYDVIVALTNTETYDYDVSCRNDESSVLLFYSSKKIEMVKHVCVFFYKVVENDKLESYTFDVYVLKNEFGNKIIIQKYSTHPTMYVKHNSLPSECIVTLIDLQSKVQYHGLNFYSGFAGPEDGIGQNFTNIMTFSTKSQAK